ncbi:MAG: nascent polypeptide-associated complex protein [Candidatus Methanomethyliales bacterium]|nr:nascent polypeptide-associated complex protein [Candidatus Methanomethylicales archaeon]
MRRISPREAKRMMQRMGMELEEMHGILKVTFTMKDKSLVIADPQVTIMKVGGQKIYQVVGEAVEEKTEEEKIEISDEDVQLVAAQTGASIESARKALESTKGDLAQAIMLLTVKD